MSTYTVNIARNGQTWQAYRGDANTAAYVAGTYANTEYTATLTPDVPTAYVTIAAGTEVRVSGTGRFFRNTERATVLVDVHTADTIVAVRTERGRTLTVAADRVELAY